MLTKARKMVRQVVHGLLDSAAGHAPSGLRRAVEARTALLCGASERVGTQAELPRELSRYVDTIALHAYKVSDADVEMLKSAGYSEDEVFELTLCAALGAALGRYERGVAALDQAAGGRQEEMS